MDSQPPALPPDLAELGWQVVVYPDGLMCAVAPPWGCTERLGDITALIHRAYSIMRVARRWNDAIRRRELARRAAEVL